MPSEQPLNTKFPYLKARKYLHVTDQWVNVAPEVLQDLVLHSKGAVLSTLDSLPVINGAIFVPRSTIQDMFTVIDEYIVGIPCLPNDPVDTQALATWLSFGSGCETFALRLTPVMDPY